MEECALDPTMEVVFGLFLTVLSINSTLNFQPGKAVLACVCLCVCVYVCVFVRLCMHPRERPKNYKFVVFFPPLTHERPFYKASVVMEKEGSLFRFEPKKKKKKVELVTDQMEQAGMKWDFL